jgi:hypothetical protein
MRASDQLKQTCGATAKIDIVARGEFFRLSEEAFGIHRVEDELPLNVFLARQDKRDRLLMRIDQQQKRVVADWLTLEIEHVHRIAA